MLRQTSISPLRARYKTSTRNRTAKVNTVVSLLCILWFVSACSDDDVLEISEDTSGTAAESTAATPDASASDGTTNEATTAGTTDDTTGGTTDDSTTTSDTAADGSNEPTDNGTTGGTTDGATTGGSSEGATTASNTTTEGTGETTNGATTGGSTEGATTASDTTTGDTGETTVGSTEGSTDGSDNEDINAGAIPGLWNITRGDDVWYYEARANGNVTAWDYRGDAFQNGQDCFVKSIAFFRYGGGQTITVFGEDIAVDVSTIDRQVSFRNSEGIINFQRADELASIDFPICGGDSNNFGVIPGLWDTTLGDDIQYFEAIADGNVSIWNYRGDTFDNGQDCYEKTSALFSVGGELTMEVLGQGIVVSVDTAASKVTFSDSDGVVDFPRVIGIRSSEFNVCE